MLLFHLDILEEIIKYLLMKNSYQPIRKNYCFLKFWINLLLQIKHFLTYFITQ
ncbi:hypothetical protein XBJ2_60045 [Xenorhabdus bovienii str. Jollieti]|uniref:Uncharacterized protein n=1 Tax=Xenorhabdus bovienii (strain SS-2004) TaxID=406818 RepID=D3UYG9_XENBS|nr:hypothetical protein XBJ1_0196 [Xenorhabdus bovienii SS-2004]CDH30189.1 hypothetical protein XBJ2_60045 [Xenorhabdus bovienii str. Jollieti]